MGNPIPSRRGFKQILLDIAQDGRRFDADKLAARIPLSGEPFNFIEPRFEGDLKIRADTLKIDGMQFKKEEWEDFHPRGYLRQGLLVRPLFKAYCYLFAALGLLSITQEESPDTLTLREKTGPLSPYDSLKTVQITPLGQWCLGLRADPPAQPIRRCEAIADQELFLVTVKGDSLERKLYLDSIGRKLGEERWRISPASFIAGCRDREEIQERIMRFKTLIDANPAPHWTGLFERVLSRAGLFDHGEEDFLVFRLPEPKKGKGLASQRENRTLMEELLGDRDLASIIFRAEGKMFLVPKRNSRKFFALLEEHGIAHFKE
jgi:hypothetical protein